MTWLYLLFALLGGAMLPLQAGINSQLAEWVGGPVRAAFVSFLVGTVSLLAIAAVVVRPLPSASRLGEMPWWAWVGGLLGAFYVAVAIVAAPRLGAAVLVTAVVAGQALASLVLDHFGWAGYSEHHVSPGRVVGMGLVFAGVALVRVF